MFGSLGAPELILLFVIALLVLGPRRLPELGRAVGKAVLEFRRATADFRQGVEKELDLKPVREANRALREARRELADLARAPMQVLERELDDSVTVRPEPPARTAPVELPAGSVPRGPGGPVVDADRTEDSPATQAPGSDASRENDARGGRNPERPE
jgi:Tat protein translocase TatB subunit